MARALPTHLLRRARKGSGHHRTDGYRSLGSVNGDGTGGPLLEHRRIVHELLGHALPRGAEVHHIDENRSNNAHDNLVVCQDHGYHVLLHRRAEALRETGDASKVRCWICKQWDDAENIMKRNPRSSFEHRHCRNAYNAARKKARKC